MYTHHGCHTGVGASGEGRITGLEMAEVGGPGEYCETGSTTNSAQPLEQDHEEKYGQGASYVDTFVPIFNEQIKKWNPTYWAKIFKSVHASYVVLTTKHHDGYTLWPSSLENPHRTSAQRSLERDIVGELSHAVWSNEIVMGLYYSGG